SASKAVTVNVSNVNEAPKITSSSTGGIVEKPTLTTVIYKVTATDVDANTTLKYSLSGTDASLLNINSITGAITFKSLTNYEDKNSYSFNVIASDGNLTSSKAIILNVNKFAPIITSSSTGKVLENSALTTIIYKATATDADANTTLKYSLSGTDASLLNINSTTGAVTLKKSANYEVKKNYSFNIIASDGSLSASKAVTVNVSNVNEAPKITSSSTDNIEENKEITTVIYKTIATDPDINSTLTYSLSGTDASLLNIDSVTGDVTLKKSANYEAKKSYSFNVIASDGSLSASKAVTVNVNNVINEEIVQMKINFYYNSNLKVSYIDTIINSSKNLENSFTGYGDISSISSSKMVYKEGFLTITINGSGFTSSSGNFTVNNVNLKFNNGESYSMDVSFSGNIYYNDFSDIFSNLRVTKLTSVIPYENGKFLTETIIGDNFYSEYSISDIKNFKYVISDGVGGNVTFSTALLKASDYNNIINGDLTLKQKIEYFSNSRFLSSDDNISIAKSTELFLNKNGKPELNGYGGNDTLTGSKLSDILNGGTGADIMLGGAGNDTYYVDNVGDKVYETKTTSSTSGDAGGIDKVNSSISYTLTSFVENLSLTGSSNINGTGNELANIITGNSGNNVLNGGAGADTLIGGAGNDTYYVDNVGDKVYETKTTSSTSGDAGGIDKVNSSISYTLTSFVENLSLTGSSNINGTGNSLNNKITGNSAANKLTGGAGNDILDGKAGIDTMIGGTGNDTYYVDNTKDVVTELASQG
ncbi:cadherin domain-containing protein, partial [Aliarcobacter butzleri]|uniref:calcium-binding protein n=1 Tax=Aliarcobacter butzleri TaxID=28197 RepID=UPI0021B40DF8